ncbi:MAG: hypothetical protein FWD71_19325 [Oscillospiraceae bacterium]|nr:hypothetical protein [Oscillospiraceae bacterium]
MNVWWSVTGIVAIIILSAVIVTLCIIYFINLFYKGKRKICQKSGHDWNGCKCRRCGEKNHEWELQDTEDIIQFDRPGPIPDNIKVNKYKCKKCGKEITEKMK